MMKPSIVFLHGACHVPEHYSPVIEYLRNADYRVIITQNPSVGAPALPNAFDEDVAQARRNILTELYAGRDVIMVCHSYGGILASAALQGLRENKGVSGRILRVVAYAAWLLPEGQSLEDLLGGDVTPWLRVENGLMYYHTAGETCYSGAPEDMKAEILPTLQPQAHETFAARATYEAWRDYPYTYVFCEKDAALPPSMKEVKPNGCEPVVVRRLPCGHTPHSLMPEELSFIIREAAGEEILVAADYI